MHQKTLEISIPLMTETLFLIAGGGTGAKVAEAFIHLCATGLCPKHVHLLFVDADTTNGNLRRAKATGLAYSQMQRWPWSIQTSIGGLFGIGSRSVGLQLFQTQLHLYNLTDPIQTVRVGGIRNAVNSDEMRSVLNLLYDEEEQEAKCDDGFRARPNLGCLLIADHLNKRFAASTEARRFLEALQLASTGGKPVPVIVAASIFGGMGASLLPVVRGCVEQAFKAQEDRQVNTDLFRWAAVQMLPHYQPQQKKKSVDPDRYLLDTASALQYYSSIHDERQGAGTEGYHAIYLIGSDRPSRNTVKTVLGQAEQANPAYFEEFLGALAALDFAGSSGSVDRPVRVFRPPQGKAQITWEDLPLAQPSEGKLRLAYLLHAAAFYLRQGSHDRGELSQGLAALLRNSPADHIYAHGWYKNVLDPWASHVPKYRNAKPLERPGILRSRDGLGELSTVAMEKDVTEYFGRLLMWADTALRGEALHLLDLINEDYASLYGSMAKLKARDLDNHNGSTIEAEKDNALVRLMRTAVTAMVVEHERTRQGPIVLGQAFRVSEADTRIGLRVTVEQVRSTLQDTALQEVVQEYGRTRI